MPWPSLLDYNEAIQNPRTCFEESDLKTAIVEYDNLGPKARTGNFASVYKFDCGGKKWAVKCFNRQTQDQQERFAAINAHLHRVALPYTVDFSYLAKGIRVGGNWFPIIKMEWADGLTLEKWIKSNLHNRAALMTFLQSFFSMLSALQRASIAHGDLQHGNILVINSAPKLVDYDGMYVPALSGRTSAELGQSNYQNPRRSAHDFGPYLDNFSGWVIALSVFALTVDPKLWQIFKGGEDDCLLFRKRDFEAPNQSALFKALEGEPNQDLRQLVTLFKTVIACTPQSAPAIAETFSLPSLPVQSAHATVPDWLQDHLPVTPRTSTAPPPQANIGWLLDATNPTGPPLKFENPIADVRIAAYMSLAILIFAIQFAIRTSMPMLLLSVPSLAGLNLLLWRSRYRREPAVSQLSSVALQRNELRERIRVMDSQVSEIELEKEKLNRDVSERKANIAKEGKQLETTEQKTVKENDATLQASISASLRSKQQLDSKENSDLNALQNSLGRTVAGLNQSIIALAQAETNELTNALNSIQRAFMQNSLQNARIRSASIPGIGAAYKTRLEAARIVTAADIDYRINSVKGIGAQRGSALLDWRRSIEADAKSRMPRTVSWQDQNNIKLKYAGQKGTLESQLNRNQEDLTNQEAAIRAKYAGLRMPLDAVVASERQKHQAEMARITAEFAQKRAGLGAKIREAEQDAIREVTKRDGRQNEVRKETFSLQWRMGKVEREIGRFSDVSFGSYVRHVVLFA
jgi:serine/threonine protein kinase